MFNLLTLHLNLVGVRGLSVVLCRSPEGAAPFKVSQTSRGAGRTTASFSTSQRLEQGAAVLRIHAAQKKTLCDALEGYKQPVRRAEGVCWHRQQLVLFLYFFQG